MSSHTRRQFCSAFGGAAFLTGTNHISWPLKSLHQAVKSGPAASNPLFEEVPASASKITFRHVNGRSPDYYLDRKSVVEGKSVDLGGRRIIQKNKPTTWRF